MTSLREAGNVNHSIEFENFTSPTVAVPYELPFVIPASYGDFVIAGLNL